MEKPYNWNIRKIWEDLIDLYNRENGTAYIVKDVKKTAGEDDAA